MKLLFCVTGLLFLVSALFASPKMDCEPGVVLVGFGPNLTESQIEGISARYGTEVVKVNRSLQYWKLRIPEERSINEMVQILQRHPHILWAEPNGFYYGTQSYCPDDSLLESQWSYKMTQLFSFWRSETGNANVVIGILDTGADSNHPDLAAKLLQGYDFVNNDPNPEDDHGHGTHVSGIAAAITGNDIGIAGVAWDCSILPVKVLNSINQGTWDNIADGIQFAADSGAHVINMSLGDSSATSGGSFAVQNAIAYAYGKNITIIAATANDSGPVSYPAKYPEVIAVGASDTLDNVAGFSNWGPEVDVVAPGVGVLSTTYDGAYNNMSGTSMATPFVSGIAALLITANPDIKPWEVQEWLHEHAVDIDGQPQGGVNNKDGYGRVNFPTVADYCDEYCILHGAGHKNSFFEWMGKEVSGEVYWVDLLDTDGRDNYMGSHDKDGADDAVTYEFPYIPPHINPDGDSVNVLLSVIEHNCSRYSGSADEQLYLSGWFDWEADGNWIGTDDQVINNHTENPATWAQNSKSVNLEITPPDEHIYGNPICTRFRLDYGS